jgi:hypothetical protein
MVAFDLQKYGIQKKTAVSAFGIAILAACLYVILFAGVSHVSQESVGRRLNQFAEYVAREAANTGKEGKFTYGPVAIEGWAYDKQAVVTNVSLEVSEKALLDTNKWSFSTTRMIVRPDQTAPDHWLFIFPEAFNIIENSQLRTVVTFPSPVTYNFFETTKDGKRLQTHSLKLPEQITLSPTNNADAAMAGEKPVVITFDPNPKVKAHRYPDTREYEIAYQFSNIKVSSDNEGSLAIGSLSSQQNETSARDSRVTGKYVLHVTDLVVTENEKVSKPYEIHADFAYQGDQPNMELNRLTPNFINMSLDISQISLATEDFRFKVSGTLSMAADDPLPYGTLDVKIDHFDKFLKSELVPEHSRGSVLAAVSKVTGNTPEHLAGVTDVSFPLKRDKNGVLYVGNTTFESLAATVVSALLKLPPVPVENTPAAGAPASTKENKPADPLPSVPELPAAAASPPAPAEPPAPPPAAVPPTPRSNEGDAL